MKIATPWLGVSTIAAVVVVAGALLPSLRSDARFLALMHLSLGTLISLAVGRTVAGFADPAGYPAPVTDAWAERVYRSQKRVGFGFSLLLAVLLGYAAMSGRFAQMGGWLLLPLAFIAPVLHLRDARRLGRRGRDGGS